MFSDFTSCKTSFLFCQAFPERWHPAAWKMQLLVLKTGQAGLRSLGLRSSPISDRFWTGSLKMKQPPWTHVYLDLQVSCQKNVQCPWCLRFRATQFDLERWSWFGPGMHLGLPDLGKYPPSQQEAMFKDARMEVLQVVISDDFSKKSKWSAILIWFLGVNVQWTLNGHISCKAFDGNVDALGLKSTGNAPWKHSQDLASSKS